MTYDHAVKVNGKWYKAGDEVQFPSSALVTAEVKEQVCTVEEPKEEKVEKATKPTTAKRSYKKKESK